MKNLVIFPWSNKSDNDLLIQSIKEASLEEITVMILVLSNIDESVEQIHEKVVFSLANVEKVHILELIEHELSIQERLSKVESTLTDIMKKNNCHLYLMLKPFPSPFLQMVTHYCVANYYDKLTVLANSEKEQGIELESMQVKPYLLEKEFNHHFYELVASDNYRAAQLLIANDKVPQQLERLLNFGQELLSFQIRKSRPGVIDPFDVLIAQLEKYGEKTEVAYVKEMKQLQSREQKTFIKFLYNYAEMLYKENDLIDFIVLFYRLAEETLLYSLGWDINPKKGPYQNRVVIRKDSIFSLSIPKVKVTNHFHSYMKELKREIRKIEKIFDVTIRRDKVIGLERLPQREQYFAKLYKLFTDKGLEKILELRHEGVSGHGFADFTKTKFETICNGNPPLQKMHPILIRLELMPEYSIFQLLQKGILRAAAYKKEQPKLEEIM